MKSIEIKEARTTHPVTDIITKRWSARSFSDQPITAQAMETLFEAARWTASSMNEQPWKFLYALKGSAGFQRMTDCLMDGNKIWAQHGASMVLSLAKKKFDRDGSPNRHAMHDAGAANTTMLLQAAHDNIYGHMLGGFHMEQTLANFNINPEEWEPACFIVLGYLGDYSQLEEPFQSREITPRSRKSLTEFTEMLP